MNLFLLQVWISRSSSSSRKRDVYNARFNGGEERGGRKKKEKLSFVSLRSESGPWRRQARDGHRRPQPVFSQDAKEEVRSDNNEFRCRPFRPSRRARSRKLDLAANSSFLPPSLPLFTFRAAFFFAARSRQIFIWPAIVSVLIGRKETLGFWILVPIIFPGFRSRNWW